MARIDGLADGKGGPLVRLAYWLSRRRLGTVTDSMRVIAHNGWILRAFGAFELALDRSRLIDRRLKLLGALKAATLIGCPY